MIDYALLNEKRAVFGALSAILSYPEKRFINDKFYSQKYSEKRIQGNSCTLFGKRCPR
ncbi:hypothetical protein [Listeria riparia]|uniref:hypothetical protein n=1 Tax=Listeria riparia TaxID=1494964 RepID=UPI00131F2E32|nr:hypothetical protein [Listeria riparia]